MSYPPATSQGGLVTRTAKLATIGLAVVSMLAAILTLGVISSPDAAAIPPAPHVDTLCFSIDHGAGAQSLTAVDLDTLALYDEDQILATGQIENIALNNETGVIYAYDWNSTPNSMYTLTYDAAGALVVTDLNWVGEDFNGEAPGGDDIDAMFWVNDANGTTADDQLWMVVDASNESTTVAPFGWLVQVDPATGAILSGPTEILIPAADPAVAWGVEGATWIDGVFYITYTDTGSQTQVSQLATIDPTTGVITNVGDAVVDVEGLGTDGESNVYITTGEDGATSNQLWAIDPADASTTNLADLAALAGDSDYESVDCAFPEIGLAKELTGGPTADADGNWVVTYTFVVENTGVLPLENVVVTDPFDLYVDDDTPDAGDVPVQAVVGAPVEDSNTCDDAGPDAALVDDLLIDATCTVVMTVVYDGTVINDPNVIYYNSATVTADDPFNQVVTDISQDGPDVDPDNDPNTDPVDDIIRTPFQIDVVVDPSIAIYKTVVANQADCPTTAADAIANDGQDAIAMAEGGSVWFCLTVVNGPVALTDVVVSDSQNPAGDVAIANLAADAVEFIAYEVNPVEFGAGDVVDNVAVVTAPNPDPAGPELTDTDPAQVLQAEINLIKTVLAGANAACPTTAADALATDGLDTQIIADGDAVTWCFFVENTGAADLTNVTIADDTLAGGPWVIGALAAGATDATQSVSTNAVYGGADSVINVATVTGEFDDGSGAPLPTVTDTDNAQIIPPAELAILKTVVADGAACPADYDAALALVGNPGLDTIEAAAGTQVTYCVNVINNGSTTASDVTTDDTFAEGDAGPWTIAAGAEESYSYAHTVIEDSRTNTVDLFGNDADGNPLGGVDANGNPLPVDTDTAGTTPPDALASIGNYVWFDFNGDGIQDAGETPVEGVLVEVLDAAGTVIGSDTTLADGSWFVGDLPAGTYTVQFTAPNGTSITQQNIGDDTLDSDADPITGLTGPYTLTAGQYDDTVDLGLIPVPVIGLAKDLTGGPTQTADGDWAMQFTFVIENLGPVPLDNIQLTDDFATVFAPDGTVLQGPTPNDVAGDCSTTAATGTATLAVGASCTAVWDVVISSGLVPGTIYNNVAVATGDGPDDTETTDIADDGTEPDSSGDGDPTQEGENDPTPVVINDPDKASVGDTVWYDLNGNGLQDPNEPGVPGVTVLLYPDGATDPSASVVTDANGNYAFTDLDPGDYSIVFVLPTGAVFTTQGDGTDPGNDSNPSNLGLTDTFTLVGGDNDPTIDAGLIQLASLGDFVWYDANGNGLYDTGEAFVEGATVTLYFANADGSLGNAVGTETTDADGLYLFTGLTPGDYIAVIDTNGAGALTTLNAGDDTLDSDFDPATGQTGVITLANGENDRSVDAGVVSGPVIGLAKNLTGGPTENADGNWEMQFSFVIENLGPVPLTNIQLADDFAAVFSPDATVISGPTPNASGDCSTTAATGTATLAVDATCTAVWDVVISSGLVAGKTYNNVATVTADGPSGESTSDIADDGTAPDTDGDGVANEDGENDPTPVTIPSPGTGSIGDTVFVDSDNDGIQDAGEAGVSGMTVQVIDASGNVVGSDVTDANGAWLVSNLAPGTYTVKFVLGSGQSFTTQGVGSDSTIDSDPNIATGVTGEIVVGAGDNITNIDAGIRINSTVYTAPLTPYTGPYTPAPVVTAPLVQNPPLAVTGSSATTLATVAVALMGAGGLLLIGVRRERADES